MRCPVPFTAVAAMVPLLPKAVLPENIAIAGGIGRIEQRDDALRILANYPHINAVALIDRQRQAVDDAISALSEASRFIDARRFAIKQPVHTELTLSTYFGQRVAHSALPRLTKENSEAFVAQTVNGILPLVRTINDEVRAGVDGHLQTTMTYVDDYIVTRSKDAFINAHLDKPEPGASYDAREVECCNGSGTVLFADNDFEKMPEAGRSFPGLARLLRSQVSCWILPEGSSIVMRAGETVNPCVHSHGISDGVNREQRLTFRHDFKLGF